MLRSPRAVQPWLMPFREREGVISATEDQARKQIVAEAVVRKRAWLAHQ